MANDDVVEFYKSEDIRIENLRNLISAHIDDRRSRLEFLLAFLNEEEHHRIMLPILDFHNFLRQVQCRVDFADSDLKIKMLATYFSMDQGGLSSISIEDEWKSLGLDLKFNTEPEKYLSEYNERIAEIQTLLKNIDEGLQ